jgi:hypothetical protein
VVEFSEIIGEGTIRHGQGFFADLERFPATRAPVDHDLFRVWIQKGETDPSVFNELLEERVGMNDSEKAVLLGFNNEQDTDGFMNFDGLERKPCAEVSLVPVHDAE